MLPREEKVLPLTRVIFSVSLVLFHLFHVVCILYQLQLFVLFLVRRRKTGMTDTRLFLITATTVISEKKGKFLLALGKREQKGNALIPFFVNRNERVHGTRLAMKQAAKKMRFPKSQWIDHIFSMIPQSMLHYFFFNACKSRYNFIQLFFILNYN